MLPFAIPQLVRRLRRRGSCRNHAQDATNWRKSQPETRVFWLTLAIERIEQVRTLRKHIGAPRGPRRLGTSRLRRIQTQRVTVSVLKPGHDQRLQHERLDRTRARLTGCERNGDGPARTRHLVRRPLFDNRSTGLSRDFTVDIRMAVWKRQASRNRGNGTSRSRIFRKVLPVENGNTLKTGNKSANQAGISAGRGKRKREGAIERYGTTLRLFRYVPHCRVPRLIGSRLYASPIGELRRPNTGEKVSGEGNRSIAGSGGSIRKNLRKMSYETLAKAASMTAIVRLGRKTDDTRSRQTADQLSQRGTRLDQKWTQTVKSEHAPSKPPGERVQHEREPVNGLRQRMNRGGAGEPPARRRPMCRNAAGTSDVTPMAGQPNHPE